MFSCWRALVVAQIRIYLLSTEQFVLQQALCQFNICKGCNKLSCLAVCCAVKSCLLRVDKLIMQDLECLDLVFFLKNRKCYSEANNSSCYNSSY